MDKLVEQAVVKSLGVSAATLMVDRFSLWSLAYTALSTRDSRDRSGATLHPPPGG